MGDSFLVGLLTNGDLLREGDEIPGDLLRRGDACLGDLLRRGEERPGDLLRVGLNNVFGRWLLIFGDLFREVPGVGLWDFPSNFFTFSFTGPSDFPSNFMTFSFTGLLA